MKGKSGPVAGIEPAQLRELAESSWVRNKDLADRLSAAPPENLDNLIHAGHRAQFARIDCLECANCCKTTPALVVAEDMPRIAGYLKISVGHFIKQFLEMDEDGDFVTSGRPCPFLGPDNRCGIYEVRPASCRDYPLTLLEGQADILGITLEDTAVCPAVYRIFEHLQEIFPA